MNEIKAKVATVKFGHIEIEGLQATDGIGEFNLRFKGKTSLGSKETMSESELERFNRQATLTVMYIKSGYDLQEALNKVFN